VIYGPLDLPRKRARRQVLRTRIGSACAPTEPLRPAEIRGAEPDRTYGLMKRGPLFLAIAVGLAGCASSDEAPAAAPSDHVSATQGSKDDAGGSPSRLPEVPSEAVRFRASDGTRIEGRLFGDGQVAIVLAHQVDQVQSAWYAFAGELAGRGYVALTFNFRGYCPGGADGCSGEGSVGTDGWQDVAGAVRFLNERGVKRVFLTGASIGGWAVLEAAVRGVPVDGVVTLSGVPTVGYDITRAGLSRVDIPLVFVVGRFDGSLARAVRRVHRLAPEPKELLVLPTGEHGTNLLRYAAPEVQAKLRELMYATYGHP
jgi:dienelactone hydrolase